MTDSLAKSAYKTAHKLLKDQRDAVVRYKLFIHGYDAYLCYQLSFSINFHLLVN